MSYPIQKIYLFPFKSLKGIEVGECQIDEHGLLNDRIYMLAHRQKSGNWIAITQRSEPSMARISQRIEGHDLVLHYKSVSGEDRSIKLPLDVNQWSIDLPKVEMELWGFNMQCLNVGNDETINFFVKFFTEVAMSQGKRSKYFPEDVAILASGLRRKVPETERLMGGNVKRDITSSFQDLWPGSLMTTSSYTDLATHVSTMDEEASINMNSFRMNFLVETDEAWIEDDWKSLDIGDHVWGVQGPCERCSMPAVDQLKGETRQNRHPLPSLNRFRILEKGQAPCFGINIVNKEFGYSIRVGDQVRPQ